MKLKTKIILVVTIIVVIALASFLVLRYSKKNTPVITTKTQVAPQKTEAPAGTLTAGFPASAVEAGNKITSSYQIKTPQGNSSTAQFTSTKSVQEVYSYYQTYLTAQKFTLSSKNYTSTIASIFGYKEGGQNVNVTISKGVSSTNIVVVYTVN